MGRTRDGPLTTRWALPYCIPQWVEAGDLEAQTELENPVRYHEAWHSLCSAKGILIPGGFGSRGTEGMVSAARWAREKRVPFLGICLGFQVAVIEFARNVCGIKGERAVGRVLWRSDVRVSHPTSKANPQVAV